MAKRKARSGGPVTVIWDNPPGPEQSLTIRRVIRGHMFERRVGPNGLVSPTEAAFALSVSRVYVYRLIWDKKLRTVKRDGQLAIPLSSIKAFNAKRWKGQLWLRS